MKNTGKLIAEVMAVCCVLSTPTFFNMYGMAETGTSTSTEQFKDQLDANKLVGSNLVAAITCSLAKFEDNVGLIEYKIDCKNDSSQDRLNEVLAKLNLKTKVENKEGELINDIADISSAVEITNVAQLFDTTAETGNKLINFTLNAKKTAEDDATVTLELETTETTPGNDVSKYGKQFSVYRVGDKVPTIQYDRNQHMITLKIYVNLPEKYNAATDDKSNNYQPYHSFNVTATIKDTTQLTGNAPASTPSGSEGQGT